MIHLCSSRLNHQGAGRRHSPPRTKYKDYWEKSARGVYFSLILAPHVPGNLNWPNKAETNSNKWNWNILLIKFYYQWKIFVYVLFSILREIKKMTIWVITKGSVICNLGFIAFKINIDKSWLYSNKLEICLKGTESCKKSVKVKKKNAYQ